MAINSYKLYQNQAAREGVTLFGPKSKEHKHLAAPYPLVGSVFDIPAPLYLGPPISSKWQRKLLQGSESQLMKEVSTNAYLDKGLKRGLKSLPNPDAENSSLQAKRIKQTGKNKHKASDLLCF